MKDDVGIAVTAPLPLVMLVLARNDNAVRPQPLVRGLISPNKVVITIRKSKQCLLQEG